MIRSRAAISLGRSLTGAGRVDTGFEAKQGAEKRRRVRKKVNKKVPAVNLGVDSEWEPEVVDRSLRFLPPTSDCALVSRETASVHAFSWVTKRKE